MGVDIQTYRAKIGTFRHSYGIDVVTFVLVVNFSYGLKTVGSLLFIGLLLMMAGIEPNPGPTESGNTQSTKIKVTGLPQTADAEILTLFFENTKRQGGGKVKQVTIDNDRNSAIVEFEKAAAVDRVIKQQPVRILETEINIEVYADTNTTRPTKIKVSGLPDSATDEFLIMFFENERQGGGTVKSVTMYSDKHCAVIEFEETEAVEFVLQNQPLLIRGTEVSLEAISDGISFPCPTMPELQGLLSQDSTHTMGAIQEFVDDNLPKPEKARIPGDDPSFSQLVTQEPLGLVSQDTTKEILESVEANWTGTSVRSPEKPPIPEPRTPDVGIDDPKRKSVRDKVSYFSKAIEESSSCDRKLSLKNLTDTVKEKESSVLVSPCGDLATGAASHVSIEARLQSDRAQKPEKPPKPAKKPTKPGLILEGPGSNDHKYTDGEHNTSNVTMLDYDISSNSQQQKIKTTNDGNCKQVPSVYISSEEEPPKLLVMGIPENVTEEIMVKFFENEKKQGGGNVKNVTIDRDNKSAVLEFEEAEALDKVLQKKPIIIMGTEVTVDVFDGKCPQTTKNTRIVVSSLPKNMSVEFLTMFFENEKRFGGGPVQNVEIDEGTNSATIEFEKPEAVEAVLQKRPIVIKNKEVVVNEICKDITDMPKECSKIKVSCLPPGVTEEHLVMFFENERRYGGGQVKHAEIDQINHSAVIEFEEQAAVYKVLEKRPIVLSGQKVIVEIFDEVNEPTVMLVSGLPDDATEEFLVMFFENERRQGGGNVKTVEINFSKSHAIIEFDTPDSLKKVLGKRPIIISGKKCEISVFKGSNTIEVRGFVSSEKQLLQYFENTLLSGGETVQSVRVDKDKGVAFVSFLRPEVVKRVCERKSHTLNQRTLIVNTYISTSTSDEFKHMPESDIIYSHDQAQDPSKISSEENTQTLPEQQPTEGNFQVHDGSHSTDCLRFKQALEKLGLADKYPSKISIRDVIAVDPDEANDQEKQVHLSDIPKIILRRLISAHSDARDITTTNDSHTGKETDFDGTVSFRSEVPDEREDLSPIDVFSVVFQCCDPLMKQVFFQKLYLCKMAVPFLYQSWAAEVKETVVSVWPLRCLAIENKMKSDGNQFSSKEVDMLELSSKVLAFARFGRPSYSKSKLLNSLLSSNGCKTFFNIDCPSGMTPRYISNGQIEMFWLPTIGDKKDKFKDAVTFLNMRGDLNKHFASNVCDFTAKLADAVVIVIDLYSIQKEKDAVKRYLIQFASVILIIANPVKQEDVLIVQDFERNIKASRNDISLRVLSTHRGTIEQNVVGMVSTLSKHIISQLKSSTCRSLQQRLSDASSNGVSVRTDEEEADCHYGKNEAEKLLKQMKMDGKPRVWKQVLTPVHCKYSRELGQLKKKREREKGLTEGENIEREMMDIRKKQTKSVTTTLKYFVNILTNDTESYIKLKLVLGWLHFFIEREKRKILPQLMFKNRCAWEQLKALKSNKETKEAGDVEKQEKHITDLEREIDDASFSVEHFFREIGHICEAVLELEINASDVGLPEIDKIANVVGRLVVDGHQLELIDGESFYMPFRWTQKVLQHVNEVIKSGKVMTLSVLGLQSSGKSTLLNTMFGSQFSTRSGRCTRGIHVQLVPAIIGKYTSAATPFDYVLVVDTEGLRSPELSHIQHEHDNELATVITGLGDITMLNIMGENTSEIRDILQVIVHAFLRLKMTNRNLDIRKSCTFIHQNVTDTSASDNMISGLSKLMQTLDAMTEESAKSEGILDITTFNQVIEFDINTQVWYLKNLWQGNPPMARVNTEYSERVVDVKCRILQKALNMENKSYKSITDILEQAHNLWKGVLNEDFVFSFRNSLEIRAYMEMEMFVQDHLWQLESFICEKLLEKSQSKFSDCDQKDKLRAIADEVISDLKTLLSDEKIRKEQEISRYFEINKYKDIIIQWKTTQQVRFDSLCSKLERTIREQIEKKYTKRSVEILTISSHEKHEEELRLKSMEVANRYKGKKLSQSRKDVLFDEIWNSFVNKIDTNGCSSDTKRKSMKTIFMECLNRLFEKHSAFLKESLHASSELTQLQGLEKLSGSFAKTGIVDKDISLSLIQKGTEMIGLSDAMAHITTRVNQIFGTMDEKITHLCQVNEEITEINVNELLHDLQNSIHEILTGKRKYDFKPTFKVKIYIHVSRYAHPLFEKHNENYSKTQGVAVRLEQYKQQQKIRFEAHLSNRASEDIVAQLFSNVIEGFAVEWTLENIPNKVTDDLHSYLPSVKNRVIIEICNSLVEDDSFFDFILYLHAPKDYAYRWIDKKASSRLFDKESDAYFIIARNSINGVFTKAETCLGKLKDKFLGNPPPSIDEWLDEFIFLSKDGAGQLSIPVESFRNIRKEVTIIENIEYLTDVILANMLRSKDKVLEEFRGHNRYNVQWTNSNPIERVSKTIWGCPAQCMFCSEPCAKNEDHEGDDHYSIQHRPSCCRGTYQSYTEKAALEACGFVVNSDRSHSCSVFRFACNEEKQEPCHEKRHPYREYKRFIKEWDIPPNSNMGESAKYWMWFVAKYQRNLCDFYKYKLDHLPPSWKAITKDEAKESLKKAYTASKN